MRTLRPCTVCRVIKQDQVKDGSCYECLLLYWLDYIWLIGNYQKLPLKKDFDKINNLMNEILELRKDRSNE